MLLEQEVPTLLRVGLLVVMVPVLAMLIRLCFTHKRQGYGWIVGHLVLFTICALYFTRILETRAFTSSAYNSLALASIGIVWAISMSFLVKGLLKLSNRSERESED